MEEVWKDIQGYEGHYQVSNLGRVKSLERKDLGNHIVRERIRVLIKGRNGYLQVLLCKNGKRANLSVHRLVALAFLGGPPFLTAHVNHKNGIKTDNLVTNLEWCSRSQNIQHAFKIGRRSQKGEENNAAKLDLKRVGLIRESYKQGVRIGTLMVLFSVSRTTISDIVNNRTWV